MKSYVKGFFLESIIAFSDRDDVYKNIAITVLSMKKEQGMKITRHMLEDAKQYIDERYRVSDDIPLAIAFELKAINNVYYQECGKVFYHLSEKLQQRVEEYRREHDDIYNNKVMLGDIIVLVSPKHKRYIRKILPNVEIGTADGVFTQAMLCDAYYGTCIYAPTGKPYLLQKASLYDILYGLKRKTQIIYPKDIAYICLRLGIGKDVNIIEAGSGSGGLTTALSYLTSGSGHVYTYEAREEFYKLTQDNLRWANLGENVTQYHRDIQQGFEQSNANALFLDVREPWLYLEHVVNALMPSALCAFLLPTINQVATLVEAMETMPFSDVEIEELLVRKWKAIPDRMRPYDRMVAHTSFLVFARYQCGKDEWERAQSRGTREHKQYLAKMARTEHMHIAITDDEV